MHIPVLLNEVIDGLNVQEKDIYLDCTLGNGGHARAICESAGSGVYVIGLDRDMDAIVRTEENFQTIPNKHSFICRPFSELADALLELGISSVDRVLFDLGISSPQLDISGRGFSFKKNEPLLMTMKANPNEQDITAYDVVNTWQEESLSDIIYGFGQEKYARRIAKGIVEARKIAPILNTFDLVHIIESSIPKRFYHKVHPATKTFQAIRIAVNDELGNVTRGVNIAFQCLHTGGRLAVISFHSLEDRIVKNLMKDWISEGKGKTITKKPIVPSDKEIISNPRSRSAKLRIIEKI